MTTEIVPADAPSALGRAARLRAATAPQHRDAEHRSFITKLMGGELSIDAYVAYLAQYAYVYEALESREPRASDPEVLHRGGLARFDAICADLAALGAPRWRDVHPALDQTQAYVDHILGIDGADVARYLAHHYTRYLGDLSGGQAIAALVARHYGAVEDQLTFYRFDEIDNHVAFKRAYRDALDGLDFDDAQDRALVSEAQAAFGFNAAIFDALDARLTPAA